jgi:hypothetical protein
VAEHRRETDSAVEGKPMLEGGARSAKAMHEHLFSGLRQTDIEPYTGLGYLSKLFKFMAIVLMLLLVAEIVTGVFTQGAASIPVLLGEASRLIVLAGVLWGSGDLALLLVDIGHDVRANRILMSRMAHAALPPAAPGRQRPAFGGNVPVDIRRDRPADEAPPLSARPPGERSDSSKPADREEPPLP